MSWKQERSSGEQHCFLLAPAERNTVQILQIPDHVVGAGDPTEDEEWRKHEIAQFGRVDALS